MSLLILITISSLVLLAAGCKVDLGDPAGASGNSTSSGGTGGNGGSPTLASLAVTPANPSIVQGATQQFTATGTFSDGSKQNLTSSATWTSSSTTVATVSAAGLATGVAAGSANIMASSGSVTGTTKLTVTPTLSSIAVTPNNPSIPSGTAQQFTATATFSDGSKQDLTSSVTWSSLSESVATVSNAGLASALAVGSSTITATSGTVSGSTILTVTTPILTSIAVTPSYSFILKNQQYQFAAAGTFNNGSIQDVSGSVTWSSSATGVATINTAGLLAALAAGNTTIKAASGSVNGTLSVTVTAVRPPRFAYVVNTFDATISIYTENPSTGQLRASGYAFAAGMEPTGLAVDPFGRFAYLADFQSNTVAGFTINGTTGALTPIAGSLGTGTGPVGAVVDPSGKFLYVVNSHSNSVSAYTINGSTGALTAITGSPFAVGGAIIDPSLAITDPAGKFLYVTDSGTTGANSGVSAYTINATTGALTAVAGSPFAADAGTGQAVVDPLGKFLYASNSFNDDISAYAINATTGALTQITGSPFASGAQAFSDSGGLAIDPSGQFVFMPNSNSPSNSISVFSVNATTGALTPVTGSPFAALGIGGFNLDSLGNFAYSSNGDNVTTYSINRTTGAVSIVGTTVTGLEAGALSLATGITSVSYFPTFAYVTNANGNDVSAYTTSRSNGALAAISGSPFAADTTPDAVTVEALSNPGGGPTFAYVTNANSDDVSAYTISGVTGRLTAVPGSPFVAGSLPISVSVDPSARFAYVADFVSSTVTAFTINSTTGVLTPVGTPIAFGLGGPFGLTVHPTGRFVYVVNESGTITTFSINRGTGALAPDGSPLMAGTSMASVAVDPSGNFAYVARQSGGVAGYVINATTGLLTAVAVQNPLPITNGVAITVDPSGKFVYMANNASNNVSAFTINTSTGALTSVAGSPFPAGTGPFSVAVDPSGSFVYVANNGSNNVSVYTINSTTGALSPVSGSPFPAGTAPSSVAISGGIQ